MFHLNLEKTFESNFAINFPVVLEYRGTERGDEEPRRPDARPQLHLPQPNRGDGSDDKPSL